MPDDIADHRRTSYELWQQLAARWERQRRTLWEPSRRVSEWLVDRLDPEAGQTVLELAAANLQPVWERRVFLRRRAWESTDG